MQSMANPESRLRDQVQVDEALDGLDVRRHKITGSIFAVEAEGMGFPSRLSISAMIDGLPDPP